MSEQGYLLGQGRAYLYEIDPATKLGIKGRFVGNVPTGGLVLTPGVQRFEHFEEYTGFNRKDLVLERNQMASLTLRMEKVIDRENLKVALFGEGSTLAGATVSAEPHTAHLGYHFSLNRLNVTEFTSLTSAGGSPTTYAAGTDYIVESLKTGRIFIPSNSTIPDGSAVRANYVAGASDRVTGYSALNKELWVRFEGLNNADDNAPVVLEAFKVRFNPAAAIDFINTQNLTVLELAGECLYEEILDTVAGYEGGMYRLMYA